MPDSRYIDTPHGPIHVRTTEGGGGEVAVAVHGLGGSARNWDPIAARLDRTVVAVDLPGFGRSTPRPGDQIDAQVGAVVEVIETLGIDSVTLVGNSMGGLVCQLVAAARPETVATMVLIAPATPLPPRTPPSDPAVAARLVTQSLPGVGSFISRRLQERSTPVQIVDATFALLTANRGSISPAAIEAAIENAELRRSMPWAPDTFAASAAAVRRRLVRRSAFVALVRKMPARTLLIWGDQDRLVSPSSMRWLASLRPDWTAVEMEGIGHVPMLESPATVIEMITRWTTGQETARTAGG
ncbi:MAG: alpha/beta fold hydrolase [Acidimicrobiia bacterium]